MSKVYVISDPHLGHKRIVDFGHREGTTSEEHDDWFRDNWKATVTKRDVVWVLGDVAFTIPALHSFGDLPGHKKLILGNHDEFPAHLYSAYFTVYPGLVRYKRTWLSHCPIHPQELRGLKNVHGHVHHNTVPDTDNYRNVCVDAAIDGKPIPFEHILEWRDQAPCKQP